MTLVDDATRYPKAIPLKTIHSREVAEALVKIFSWVGLPKEIVSDQGASLVGNLMKHLYELLGIRHIKTSVYHPEAHGLVKRFNGTLKHMLKKLVGNEIEYWDKYLPFVVLHRWRCPVNQLDIPVLNYYLGEQYGTSDCG